MSLFHVFRLHDTIEVEPVYFPAASSSSSSSQQSLHTISKEQDNILANEHQQQQLEEVEKCNEPYISTFEDVLIHRLTEKYVGKVIPSCGLCVAVHEIESFSPSVIKGITAAAWLSVTFALCVFSPARESRLRATIVSQNANGIYLTMSEFCASYPIFIPANELVPNSEFDVQRQAWFCLIDQAKNVSSSNNSNTNNNSTNLSERREVLDELAHNKSAEQYNEYVIGDEVIVRVLECHVSSSEEHDANNEVKGKLTTLPLSIMNNTNLNINETDNAIINNNNNNYNSKSSPLSLMEIRVSCVGDGLGPVAWFM